MQRFSTPQEKEPHRREDGREEPEQHIDQIDPHGILHPLDSAVSLGFLMHKHLPKDPEHGCPENTNGRSSILFLLH